MAAVTICSDFGAPQNKVNHYFHYFPIYLPSSDGRRIKGLWKFPDGRDWLRGKLGLVLKGGAMLSKSIIQFSVEGRGCVPFLLFDLRPNYGGGNEDNGSVWFSYVQLFATPWTAAGQASLSVTKSQNLLKLISIELMMPFNHLILCCPLLLPPSAFPSIRLFSNESALHIRWPKYWSFRFSIIPSKECSGLSLPWGSFHKPFTLLHQRVDRMETTITEN